MGQQTRSAALRNTVQRRFNSSQTKPDWIVDNAFNRERENVKHHAASTSSRFSSNDSRSILLLRFLFW
jgi:cytochrome c oxidase subunit 6a